MVTAIEGGRAAVLRRVGDPLDVVTDLTVEAPGPGEVLVRMAASGICHTDLTAARGDLPVGELPAVLGHEGAAVVEAVGPGVTGVASGDHVVISWVPQCGHCYFCLRGQPHLCETGAVSSTAGTLLGGGTRSSSGGQTLRQMCGVGTFAEYAVLPVSAVVPVPADVGLTVAALLGCGVLTGVGAAVNTARIQAGDVVAVVGCGGVGLNAVQGALIAGAGLVVAVDVRADALALARRFGAGETVEGDGRDAIKAVRRLTGGRGADVVLEVVGRAESIATAVRMSRRGGQVVLVGVPPGDVRLDVPVLTGLVAADRTVAGSWYGGADVRRDVPRLLGWYREGRLALDTLIAHTCRLEQAGFELGVLGTHGPGRVVVEYT